MKCLTVLGLAAALAVLPVTPGSTQEVMGANSVTGAGSTFAYPVLSKWAQGYQRWLSGGSEVRVASAGLDDLPTVRPLDYEPIGSLAGTMRVRVGAVDFGASDVPIPSDDLTKLGLGQFPIVIGGVVAAVNIDGVGPGEIKLSGPVIADIYLGKVTTWKDPAVVALNPNLKLPDAKIVVVRRAEGSGTTYNFTNYLSKVSPTWREQVGFDTLVQWPTGTTGAKGNEGVAQAILRNKNSIGYVEFAQATQMKLSYALVQNRAGKFVMPGRESFQAAAASADWGQTKDFHLLLTDAPGDEAYPIVATVFVLMPKSGSASRTRAALNFFQWSLEKGADDAANLGYVPLPPALVSQIKGYWQGSYRAGI